MSLDQPPSPLPGGGWASPGLATTPPLERRSPLSKSPLKKNYGDLQQGANVTWDSAKAGSARVNGYVSSYQSFNQGFFTDHIRRFSSSLPYFSRAREEDRFAEKEKLGRGRIPYRMPFRDWTLQDWKLLPRRVGLLLLRRKKYVMLVLAFILAVVLFNNPSKL